MESKFNNRRTVELESFQDAAQSLAIYDEHDFNREFGLGLSFSRSADFSVTIVPVDKNHKGDSLQPVSVTFEWNDLDLEGDEDA